VSFFTQGFDTGCSMTPLPATCIPYAADLPVTVQESPNLTGANNTQVYDPASVGQSAQIGSLQLYPYNNYFAWAGDTSDAQPSLYGVTAVGVDATQSSPSLALPVYPLVVKTTGITSGYTLQATENLTPQHTISLSDLTSGVSSTGVPLGQYQLTASGHTVTCGGSTSACWVWVTNNGVLPEATASSSSTPPTTGLTAPGAPITVTVS
jgi:hypothetical protein